MKTKTPVRILSTSAAALLALVGSTQSAKAQAISLTAAGTYTQNFDTLPAATGSWADNTTLAGWYATSMNTFPATGVLSPLPLTAYTAGAARASGFFSALSNVAGDRALVWGATTTGYGASAAGVLFQNNSGSSLSIGNVSFSGEMYVAHGTANTLDGLSFSYQVSNTPITSVAGTAVHNNAGTFAANAALVDTGWTNVSALEYSASSATAGQVFATPAATPKSSALGVTLLPGQYIALRWRSFNETGTDGMVGFDNLSVSYSLVGTNLTYNLAHSVGGAPNGTWTVSGSQYWLNGVTPLGYADNDVVTFSQNPGAGNTATINVPSNVAPNSTTVSHTDGTYSIGGAGSISGSLTKTGSGNLTLTSANSFSSVSIAGGIVATSNNLALGTGGLAVTGPVTVQTNADLTISGALTGSAAITKTGVGALTLSGTGTATGGITVSAGKVASDNGAAFGAATQIVNLNGTAIEFTNQGAATTFASVVNIGASGGTISVTSPLNVTASGVNLTAANRITSSGTITKTGTGVLRFAAAATNALTNNWIVDGGIVEIAAAANVGTGAFTLNPSSLAGTRGHGSITSISGITFPNNITLNGGGLGVRSSNTATPLENYSGAITVTADSFMSAKRTSTFANYNGFFISGLLSGGNSLTLTGPIAATVTEETPVNPNLALANTVHTLGAVTLTNTGNTYSGNFIVNSQQILSALPSTGTGDVLGTSTVQLKGGALRILDNGAADNGILNYNHALTVATPTDAINPGVATIIVDRQTNAAAPSATNPSIQGTFVGNAVQFPTLSIPGGLGIKTVGANGYAVRVSGATAISGAGNATFDVDSANLTLNGGLSGASAGVVKSGVGTLTLAGAVNYGGNTTVDAGVLNVLGVAGGFSVGAGKTLSGTGSLSGGVSVVGGGVVAPGNATGVGTLTFSDLSLGTASLNYVWNAGTIGSIAVTGTDTLALTGGTGSVTFNFANQSPNLGLHTLIDYTGTPLANLTKFTVGSIFSRIAYSLVNNTTDTKVELNVTGLNYPIWSGATSSEWSANVLGAPKNWKLSSDNSNTDFIVGDRVVFNDAAVSASPTVDVSVADVSPLSVDVDGAKNYTFTGTAAIAGAGSLTKTGTGKLTISSTNSFTGAVNLNGGVVSVATVADSAANSPLGAGTAINLGGGTLEFTGAAGSTNRGVAVAAGGGTVSAPNGSTLTLSGVVSGAGTLAKSGSGTVVLTGATNTVGGYNVSQGTLQVGDGVAAGSLGTGAVTNNATLAFNTPAAGLIVGNVISGTGSVTKTGPGSVTLNGTADNTFAGTTTVSGGSLILSSPVGINSVGGNVVVEAGGIVAYGTTAGQLANHIPDTASIIVNGGTFGSGAGNAETAPTAGIFDTVANVTVNSGTFLSGRGDAQFFTITGALNATGGRVFLQRGGSVAAASVSLASGVILDMDGGSTGAGFISRLGVGTGGLTINGATVNMNSGSNVTATSQGSSIILAGDLTTTGTTTISRISTQAAPRANIDVNGADRVFNVTGTLTLGTPAAQVIVVNTGATPGGIIKQGPGSLVLNGANTYNGNTDILAGNVTLKGTLSGSASINVATGSTFDVSGAAGYAVGATQTIKGNGNVIGSTTINGTLAPGSSIGTLNFANDLVFGATGTGLFEINKTGLVRTADLANVTGALTLAGTLNVTATGDALVEGDKFNLFDAASFSGTMAMGTMPTLNPGLFWSFADLGVDGTISVIPEPGSAALLALGSALLFRRRRNA